MIKKSLLVLSFLSIVAFLYSQQRADALKMYQNGQYKDSIETCILEITENPKNMDSYAVLVWSLIADQQYERALYFCELSKEVSEYDPRILFSEAEANYFLGKNIQAINLFEKYIVYAPNGSKLAYVYYYFGEIYLRLKMFAHADIAFTTATHLNPNTASWWERLGYAREQMRDFTFALQAYEKALHLDQNFLDAKNAKLRLLKRLQR